MKKENIKYLILLIIATSICTINFSSFTRKTIRPELLEAGKKIRAIIEKSKKSSKLPKHKTLDNNQTKKICP